METRSSQIFFCYMYKSSKMGGVGSHWFRIDQSEHTWSTPSINISPSRRRPREAWKLVALLCEEGQTWLWMWFLNEYTNGYHRPILAGCDDSFIVIRGHQGVSTLLEKERQRDLPSNLSSLQLNFMTACWRMCTPILGRCDGMASALPSSLHIIMEHQHCPRE